MAQSEVWSGVVDKLKIVKDGQALLPQESSDQAALTRLRHELNQRYDDVKVVTDGFASSIYAMDQRISYYSGKVAALEGEKSKAVRRDIAELTERLNRQEDAIADLKEEVLVLRGNRCQCGEQEPAVSSEVGELEYVENEVFPFRTFDFNEV